MAKRSEFEFLDGQKHKQIDKVSLKGGDVSIAFSIHRENVDGENEVDRGSIRCGEPAHEDLENALCSLKEFVKQYYVSRAPAPISKAWERSLSIVEVKFRHNDNKADTAAITATFNGEFDGQSGTITTPATALYDQEVEGHAAGAVATFGEHLTGQLRIIEDEARKYLGGKRGAMQSVIEMTSEGDE